MYVIACHTTAGRVHPENVTVRHKHLQATVGWDFDGNLACHISGFEVVLTPMAGQERPITKKAEKTDNHVTFQPLHPSTKYVPTVTALYMDNKKIKCEGESFRIPGTFYITAVIS